MQVFVSAKAAHPAQADLLEAIEAAVQAAGKACFVAPRQLARRGLTPGFMQTIRAELQRSHLVIVLYAPQLRGGLVELGMAYALNIPIWLCCAEGETVSSTALECATEVIRYHGADDLLSRLQRALADQSR